MLFYTGIAGDRYIYMGDLLVEQTYVVELENDVICIDKIYVNGEICAKISNIFGFGIILNKLKIKQMHKM